ncbi:1958_t:CDS:1 [Ambispora gerdemannii]|uniref:1958_t:CDS:1 n=1 Tax=Ambispora gerdemannii TaxID=144530 RepID=A0A9N9HCZ8_9GLOM|nr:1958_t:CDS:1 [Ambispora gerdemannii]
MLSILKFLLSFIIIGAVLARIGQDNTLFSSKVKIHDGSNSVKTNSLLPDQKYSTETNIDTKENTKLVFSSVTPLSSLPRPNIPISNTNMKQRKTLPSFTKEAKAPHEQFFRYTTPYKRIFLDFGDYGNFIPYIHIDKLGKRFKFGPDFEHRLFGRRRFYEELYGDI